MADLIRYGQKIFIEHAGTRKFLAAGGASFPGGSGQPSVFGNGDDTPANDWKVKPRHGGSGPGDVVGPAHGDVIRLEHVQTSRNLHSHASSHSTITKADWEVTTYGANGEGDANDDWRLDLGGEGQWVAGAPFRLVHVDPRAALRVPGPAYENPAFPMGAVEVSADPTQSSDNTKWLAHAAEASPERAREEFRPLRFDLAAGGGEFAFGAREEATAWWETEKKLYAWVEPYEGRFEIARQVGAAVKRIDEALAAALSSRRGALSWESLKRTVESTYEKEALRHSSTPAGQFIRELAGANKEVAIGGLIYFLHGTEKPDGPGAAGISRAVLFDLGVTGEVARRRSLDGLAARGLAQLAEMAREVERIRAAGESKCVELEAVRKSYVEEMALRAPIAYWTSKAAGHKFAHNWFFFFFMLVAVAAAVGFLIFIAATLQGAKADPWRIAEYVAVAFPTIWVMRVLARYLLSHSHLKADADERAVMLQTYLSLLKEPNAMSPEDRKLILAPLFASTQTGLVRDDAAPLTPLEFLSRLGS